jgi:hypothetical protein
MPEPAMVNLQIAKFIFVIGALWDFAKLELNCIL